MASWGAAPILDPTIMNFRGAFDANTWTPALANGTGDIWDFWRVWVAGTYNFWGWDIDLKVWDEIIYNGTTWDVYPSADDATAWVHITETALAPATAGEPTFSEIQAYIAGLTTDTANTHYFYTGSDIATDTTLKSYYSDISSLVKIIYDAGETVEVYRQDFTGLTVWQTNFTLASPFPSDTTLLRIYRAWVLINEWLAEDYVTNVAAQQFDLNTAITNTNERVTALWITNPGGEFKQNFSPLAWVTNLTVTVNGGVLPTNTKSSNSV